jgi:hypothetical protein
MEYILIIKYIIQFKSHFLNVKKVRIMVGHGIHCHVVIIICIIKLKLIMLDLVQLGNLT